MSDLTQESSPVFCHFDYGALTRYGRPFQGRSSMTAESVQEVLQPPVQARGLGCSPFARHYSENLYLISFPPLLRCFSSQSDLPALFSHRFSLRASRAMAEECGVMEYDFHGVSPFGNPRL